MLGGDVAGLDVVELGGGAAYWSAWFARRGARPAGVDLSEQQLATARELQAERGLDFALLHASAEAVPLPDASFDLDDLYSPDGAEQTRFGWSRRSWPAAGRTRRSGSRGACGDALVTVRRAPGRPAPAGSRPAA